jgi:hypothetical protein
MGGAEAAAARGDPQLPQKRWPGAFAAPQDPQITASAVPHDPQNFCPAGFSVPQVGQALMTRA